MKFRLLNWIVLLLFSACSSPGLTPAPNILLIVADDVGWNDVGYHNPDIFTPNVDALGAQGVVLDQFYVYPTCSPTRAALLTGRYASRFGITHPIAMKSTRVLPAEVTTLPGFLQQRGYETAITGKWHLGLRPESGPLQYGFKYSYGFLHGQIDQLSHRYKNGDQSWHRMDRFFEEPGHATDLITDEAIDFIRSKRDKVKPFFLYMAYSVPHYPVQEEAQWQQRYQEKDMTGSRKLFAAAMTHMDHSIGRVMSVLEEEELRNSTLVVFMSDNGGQLSWTPTFEYQMKHGPYEQLGDNSPLRGAKSEVYEGGIRVPAIFNWPGVLSPGKNRDLIKVTDIFATIAVVCGFEEADVPGLDGDNVWPVLTGKEHLTDGDLFLRTNQSVMYRKGQWKLIHHATTLDSARQELFNVKDDPLEQQNLINQEREIVQQLWSALSVQVNMEDSLALSSHTGQNLSSIIENEQ